MPATTYYDLIQALEYSMRCDLVMEVFCVMRNKSQNETLPLILPIFLPGPQEHFLLTSVLLIGESHLEDGSHYGIFPSMLHGE